jgi:hypothetical protein
MFLVSRPPEGGTTNHLFEQVLTLLGESVPDFDLERHMIPEATDLLSRVWNTLVARPRTAESTRLTPGHIDPRAGAG